MTLRRQQFLRADRLLRLCRDEWLDLYHASDFCEEELTRLAQLDRRIAMLTAYRDARWP